MKRLMLVWVMILCLVPLGAWAEEETVEWFSESSELYNSRGEHFCFEIEGDHAVLTDYRVDPDASQPAIVHVPDTLGGVPLTVIDSNAFNNYGGSYDGTKVECIAIPEGVVALRSDAFQCAHDVRRIELPSTLERIDGYPFHHVHAEISFPDGNQFYQVNDGFLVDTRTDALIYCNSSSASLPLPRVSRVEEWALENYSQYQVTLEFPDSVTFIGANNAYDCVDIETIIVPGSVVELADEALRVNTATEIILNEGLRRIGAFAFEQTEITSIRIPSTVEWIGWGAFFLTEVEDQDLGLTCQIETEEEYEIRSSWPDDDE